MFKLLLFAGTSEGRKIAELLALLPLRTCVFTATEYGGSLVTQTEQMQVREGRLNAEEMANLMEKETDPDCLVLDATHPYAVEVSANIKKACQTSGREYLRIRRNTEAGKEKEGNLRSVYVQSVGEAAAYLNGTTGNILVTTGSKELKAFLQVENYQERIFARVLSLASVVTACEQIGFRGKHLICMQGPFSAEMNTAMLREFDIRYLVTKDTGVTGGFPEKAEAAQRCGCQMVIIARPEEEEGISLQECLDMLRKNYGPDIEVAAGENPQLIASNDNLDAKSEDKQNAEKTDIRLEEERGRIIVETDQKTAIEDIGRSRALNDIQLEAKENKKVQDISLVGIGAAGCSPDHTAGMTVEAVEKCRQADLLIGARRIVDSVILDRNQPERVYEYRSDQVLDYVRNHPFYQKIVILMSGDTGFFSGSKKMLAAFSQAGYEVSVYPGLSSLSYFAGKIGQSWQDADICSLHGEDCNLTGHILLHEKVFAILGKANQVADLCRKFIDYGLEDLTIYVGQSLGYPEENILCGKPADFLQAETSPLSVMMVVNPKADHRSGSRIPDEFFIRDKVPMTKEEVRTISVAKLDIRRGDLIYDVGAGSGSVTMEMAAASLDGKVFAIEKKETALALLEKNRQKCCADNVVIVPGEATEVIPSLPAPDAVFIGGSSGNLGRIIRQIREKNPAVRIVINAISLETIAETLQAIREEGYSDPEIVSVNISRAKQAGNYHLMMGQNPVYIIRL